MPELAELKLTAEYVTEVAKGKIFNRIEKNPAHKGLEIPAPYNEFRISAKNKGKEMVMFLYQYESAPYQYVPIRITMGMSGHFQLTETGKETKHAHLKFYSKDGYTLSFVDVRRFGKWKLGEEWSDNRGPDPISNFQDFVRNIKANINKKDFDKPIHEVLMNQKYFNGIGNYLRAEILYRTDCNPFISAREALESYPEIYQLCKLLPLQAYRLGGGQLKDWENPFGKKTEVDSWSDFMICYGNPKMSKITDRNGRTFWFNPIWKESNI
jgi:endonuclease VIII-like 1